MVPSFHSIHRRVILGAFACCGPLVTPFCKNLYVVTSISITTCRQKEDLDIWSNGSSSHATAPEYDRGPGRPRIIQRSTMNKDLLKIKLIWDRKQRCRLAGRNDVGVYFNNLGVLVACRLCGMNQRHIILLYDVTDFHALQLVLTYTNRIFLFFDRFHSPQSSPPHSFTWRSFRYANRIVNSDYFFSDDCVSFTSLWLRHCQWMSPLGGALVVVSVLVWCIDRIISTT